MKSRSIWTGTAAAVGMLVLILDSRTAIHGMQAGIDLCLRTLIPSLFPFFLLSILITSSLLGKSLKFLGPIGRLCGIPSGAESLLAVGLLGGYPVGAQNVALAYRNGCLSKTDAERMISFCNNAGPAFLFGIIGAAFDSLWVPWALWGIHVVSAVLIGAISNPGIQPDKVRVPQQSITLSQALQKALSVMAQVAGWVVLFRMVLTYLERWFLWMLPVEWQVILSGSLELSNGCIQLRSIGNEGLRVLAASVMLALGGACVGFQTSSVTGDLRLQPYFLGKLLQAAISFLLALCMQYFLPAQNRCTIHPALTAAVFLFAAVLVRLLRKNQNYSSIPMVIGV